MSSVTKWLEISGTSRVCDKRNCTETYWLGQICMYIFFNYAGILFHVSFLIRALAFSLLNSTHLSVVVDEDCHNGVTHKPFLFHDDVFWRIVSPAWIHGPNGHVALAINFNWTVEFERRLCVISSSRVFDGPSTQGQLFVAFVVQLDKFTLSMVHIAYFNVTFGFSRDLKAIGFLGLVHKDSASFVGGQAFTQGSTSNRSSTSGHLNGWGWWSTTWCCGINMCWSYVQPEENVTISNSTIRNFYRLVKLSN